MTELSARVELSGFLDEGSHSVNALAQFIEFATQLTQYAPVMAHPYKLIQQEECVGSLRLKMTCVRDFDEAVNDLFLELQSRGEEERLNDLCPFFAKLWPAARGLAHTLAAEGPLAPSCRVLEVGCGLALPGIVASMLGATVTLTDFHDLVPEFLERNLAANSLPGVTYTKADWRNPSTNLGTFDLIIGSDVLYDRSHASDLARFVQTHLMPDGRVIISDPGRAYLQNFTTLLQDSGFVARIDTKENIFVVSFQREA